MWVEKYRPSKVEMSWPNALASMKVKISALSVTSKWGGIYISNQVILFHRSAIVL